MVQKDFKMKLLPQSLLHTDFRGDGEGSCHIHVLRRKEDRKQKKEVRRGVQAAKSDEPHQGQQKGTPNSSTSITSASERECAVVSFPQRKARNCGGRNRNRGNTQRYDCGNGKGPAALTAQIKKSTTIKELISTHHAQESRLNHIHLSACWTSLAR